MTTKYERIIRRIRRDDRLFTDPEWMARAHHVIDRCKARAKVSHSEREYQRSLFIRE